MGTTLFFIILLIVMLGLCIGMLVLTHRQRQAEAAGDTEAVRSITRLRMRIGLCCIIALVVMLLIYYFVFGREYRAFSAYGHYSYSTLMRIIFWEFIAVQVVLFICAYRGKMNASSRFADQACLKRFSRKLLWFTLAVGVLTAVIFLLLKYTL